MTTMTRRFGCHHCCHALWWLVLAIVVIVSSSAPPPLQKQLLSHDKTKSTITTTYTLSYDGWMNLNLLASSLSPSSDGGGEHSISYSQVESISTEIASDIVQLYHVKNSHSSSANKNGSENTIDLDRRCYRDVQGSVRCALDYQHQDDKNQEQQHNILFHLDLHVYDQQGHALVRLDATVTASDKPKNEATTKNRLTSIARNMLIDSISLITQQLQMTDEPVWSIQHRPSFLEQRLDQQHLLNQQQHAEEMKRASVEQIILSPQPAGLDMMKRRRIDTTTTSTPKSSSSSNLPEQQYEDVQIWEYRPNRISSKSTLVRSLFVDGLLRATASVSSSTSLSSPAVASTIAHAEAMIHPAMVAHMAPKRIALWSSAPQPLLREILKHTSVEHVTILGATPHVVQLIRQWLPRLNDCSFRFAKSNKKEKNNATLSSCMDQPLIEVVYDTPVTAWVDGLLNNVTEYTLDEYYSGTVTTSPLDCDMKAPFVQPQCRYSQHPQFDIIFVEIPTSNLPEEPRKEDDWLSVPLHQKLLRLLAPESMVILNVGSAPILVDSKHDSGIPSPRDDFLRFAGRSDDHGGIGYTLTLVYEEPLSSPLPTTNIVCFAGDSWSYARFVQKHNPTSFDLDLTAKVYPARKKSKTARYFRNTPTLVYDGPTHVGYLQTPLVWEYWYCRHPVMGKSTFACHTFLDQWYNASYHHLSSPSTQVQRIPVKGRALFATQVIPKGHFVLSQDTALNLQMDAVRWYALERFVKDFPDATLYGNLRDFFKAYGFESEPTGMTGWSVSIACNTTFVNHGCAEAEINTDWVKELYLNGDGAFAKFSPFLTRRGEIAGVLAYATRDIHVGEEIACDYRSFRSYDDDEELEQLLERICDDGVGLVSSTSDANSGVGDDENHVETKAGNEDKDEL